MATAQTRAVGGAEVAPRGSGRPFATLARNLPAMPPDAGFSPPSTGGRRKHAPWSRADLIAVTALLASIGIPLGSKVVGDLNRTSVSIAHPRNGVMVRTNTFGVAVTASNVPAEDTLWLVVQPTINGHFYPVQDQPQPVPASWSVPAGLVCPAVGWQEIQVWTVPTSTNDTLLAFRRRALPAQVYGLSIMPGGSVLRAYAVVDVERKEC